MRLRLLCLLLLIFSGAISSWAIAPATPLGTTASTSLFSNPISQAIPDPGTITSVINVTTANTYLWDIDLTTSITHTTSEDIDIMLTSPVGTVVTITTDNGYATDNIFNGSLWDDNSGSPVTDFPHLDGVTSTPLVVEGALGAFIGENPNGNWTLTITDDNAGAAGSLVSWSLQVTTLNTPPNLSSNSFSNAIAAAIPDSAGPNISGTPLVSTISVSGLNNYLADVNLFTNITHSFMNDLVITLTSPAGTVVTVVSRVGGNQNDVFAGTLWDDDAVSLGPVTDHTYINNVLATPLQPEQAMAAFIGENPNGTWTLTVSDWFTGDAGTLNNWRLDFQTIAPTPVYNSSPLPGAVILLNTTIGIPISGFMNITEAGTADLNLSSATYTGDPQISITTNPLPTTILDGSGGIVTVGLTCNSLTGGTFTGTLTINHNAFGSPATYPITCTIPNAATITINNVTSGEGNSGTTNFGFTVTLDNAVSGGFNLQYETADGSATVADNDYVAMVGTLTFNGTAGENYTITVPVNGDVVAEGNETFTVIFPATTAPAWVTIPTSGTGTITNDDTAGVTVTESGGTTNIVEGGTTDDYTLVLTSQPASGANVDITVTPDAQCGINGQPAGTPVVVTILNLDWNTAAPVTVTANDDPTAEVSPHPCVITHTSASGDANYNGIAVAGVTANITDNDAAGIAVDTSTLTDIAEDGVATTTSFTVAALTPPTATVDVALSTDGQCSVPATVTLATGSTTPVTVTVTAVDDATSEAATHTCVITTGDVTSGDGAYDALDGSTVTDVTANVLDNDITFTVSNSGATNEGTGANTTVTFTVSPEATGAILNVGGTVDYAVTAPSTDAADYVSLPSGTLTFTTGVTTAQTVTVEVVGDSITEAGFTLELASSAATSGTTGTATVTGTPSVVNVADDDSSGIAIMQSGGSTDVAEGGATDTITVKLNTQPDSGADVSLDITPDAQCEIDGSGAGTAFTITVLNADWNTGTAFTVSAIDDTVAEGDHSCILTVSTPTSADPNYNGASVPYTLDAVAFDPTTEMITVNVTDNDVPGATFSALTVVEGASGTYTIVLNTLPADTVTVTAITPDTQCTVTVTLPLTFTTADWNVPQTISVTAVDDIDIEGAHACVITHTLTSTDPDYTGDFDHNVTINDSAPVDGGTGTTPPSTIIDTNGISVSEDVAIPGDEVTWTFTVTNVSGGTVNNVTARVTYPDDDMTGISATSSTGANGAFSRGSLLTDYALGSMSAGQTITLTVTTRLPDRAGMYSGILTVTANGVTQADTSTLTLLSVGELPATGETPLWRGWVLAVGALVAFGAVVLKGLRVISLRRA